MTAYGAAISLENTIDYILNSSYVTLIGCSQDIIRVAYKELQPLQKILESLDWTSTSRSRKKVNALDGRIKDLIWEFEDLLESYILSKQILSQFPEQVEDERTTERVWEFQGLFESPPSKQILELKKRRRQILSQSQLQFKRRGRRRLVHKRKGEARRKFNSPRVKNGSKASQSRNVLLFSIDLQCLQDDVCSFVDALEYTKREYIHELHNIAEDDEDESVPTGFDGNKSKMIGLCDEFQQLKRSLLCYFEDHFSALVGTAGVGKTTLAEAVFEDPEILTYFECRAWVTVGRKSQFDQVSQAILTQIYGTTQGDDETSKYLGKRLEGKKCLIVLDDVWERQITDSLISSLRNIDNASIRILVTTRDTSLVPSTMSWNSTLVPFLSEEESKDLLCEKVFGEKFCPLQLDKAATKIANNCEGLPLTIVTVADILSKSQNRDPKYWDDVAENRNSVFKDAYNEITKVLFPSYDYLSQYLKMPFLYMGVFPSDYNTPPSKIMNMLAAEGWFHNTNIKNSLEDSVWQCLYELCTHKNMAIYNERSIFRTSWMIGYRKYKTCRLNSSWRHVCRGEAQKNKFYRVLDKLVDGEEDGVKGQRCLCLENNILFGIKEFCKSVRANCASSTRSLFFLGPYHQYPIPVGDDFKLLRKLDALKLRFYTFPTEVLTLVLLKYLALTCNGELPPTISKLFNLQVLIIHPHSNIRICRAPPSVPIQIWDMQELEHIEILGKSLVAPSHFASLPKLSTLVGVNASIYTILELFKKVPCIRKLGVQIEMTPYDDHNDLLSCFGCISSLGTLKTLKCSIMNPVLKYDYAIPSSLMLSPGLKKLHLSGMGFPWEYMDVIGSLPLLEVLKLRAYAFRGSKWEGQEGSFLELKFLLIEDSDLVQWKPRSGSFPNLRYLRMEHCYKLEEIHWPSHFPTGKIELVNCNPVAVTCAKQLQPSPYALVVVTASSSFDEKPISINFERFGPTRLGRQVAMSCTFSNFCYFLSKYLKKSPEKELKIEKETTEICLTTNTYSFFSTITNSSPLHSFRRRRRRRHNQRGMTAYGAVISLRNTIEYILHSSCFSLVGCSGDIIQVAYNELQPLQKILERLDSTSTRMSRKKVNSLDGRIKDLIWEFENKLESLLTDQIVSQFCAHQVYEEMKHRVLQFQGLLEYLPSQSQQILELTTSKGEAPRVTNESQASQLRDVLLFSIDLHLLQDDVRSFVHTLKEMEREYIYEVDNMAEDDDDEYIPTGIGFGGTKSKMIGLSDQFQQLKRNLMHRHSWNSLLGLVGTAGVGKTALAEAILEDPEILSHFECRAWVTVGRKSQFDQVVRGILAQICGITQGDDELGDYLKERLEGKKCLIVLDDVWERQILDSLMSSLGNIVIGSIRVLVTTRDTSIVTSRITHSIILVQFLNEEESKDLLCEKVFGEKICPPQLDKAATKITKNCEGLPLMIVTVAEILSKAQNTDPKYWDDVAENRNSVFTDAYNQITKVLFPSYDYLRQYLKMPFLYMGVFPPDYDTSPHKIMHMLAAEGWFHNTNKSQSLEDSVWKCLDELCTLKNLALFNQRSIFRNLYRVDARKFKTCRLHSSWRYVCRGEERQNKFYHVLNKLVDGEGNGVKVQRCLCLENNILFGIKGFCNSVRLNCASSTRSLD